MFNRTFSVKDIVLGLCGLAGGAGIVTTVYTWRQNRKLMNVLDSAAKSVETMNPVTVSESIIREAVKNAAEKEVNKVIGGIVQSTKDKISNLVSTKVKGEVDAQYDTIHESVVAQVTKEVGKINVERLKQDVINKAKETIAEKFDDKLDSLAEEFSDKLDSVGKIYKSIANSMSGNRDREFSFKIV